MWGGVGGMIEAGLGSGYCRGKGGQNLVELRWLGWGMCPCPLSENEMHVLNIHRQTCT